MTSPSRCRRYHPVWLTHVQIEEMRCIVAKVQSEGSYYAPRDQYLKRLDEIKNALLATHGNCVDEMERPKRCPTNIA